MKIYFRIPFLYKWNNCANIKCHYEELIRLGYDVTLSSKKAEKYKPEDYDLVMLHGSGVFLTTEEFNDTNVPVWAFGWSDPNMYSNLHINSDIYFTNDLNAARKHNGVYYQTSCYRPFHRNLDLPKETDILVYGAGTHKYVTNRNEIVNNLRQQGFNVKVFGRGWDAHSDTYGFTEGEELIQEINKAHLLLDISTKDTAWPHRVFENSACGTPCLTMNREDTRMLFDENSEIFLYNDFSQISNILTKLLSDKPMLRIVGLNAQNRCYSEHEISIRIKQLLPYLEDVK